MSRSTRSFATEPWRALLAQMVLACTLAFACCATAADPPVAPASLPPAAESLVPGARLVGTGKLTFLGLQIYDGHYFAAGRGYSAAAPFALLLVYHRTLRGDAIATRSSEEIERLGMGTPEARKRWDASMRQLFPDVQPGDQLVGVNLPGKGVAFFRNGHAIGTVTDPTFGPAFFGIWFDLHTSRPGLRSHLLGD